jgi:hypothetical protein
MPLLTKIFAGFLIFVTAAALLIIFIYPSEKTTTIVAIAALVITTGKSGYEIYEKERERKKKSEESREKVTATVRYGMWDSTGRELGAIIYNAGSAPVNIASVECHYTSGGESKVLELVNLRYQRSELVPSKHTVKFRCEAFKDDLLEAMSKLPDKDVWISIKTQEGEVLKVDGKEIIRVLNSPPTCQIG